MADRRTPDPDSTPYDADAPISTNPMQVLGRRWPLFAVGIAIGLVVGGVLYIATPPQYQSSAELSVAKKRTDTALGGDVRIGVLEDVVATQVKLVKSDRIRRAAVKELRGAKLNNPLPEDDSAAAEVIRGGLNVARDKDAMSPNQVGSGVLNLTYKTRDPQDARRILEAVIKTYQNELFAIFEKSTQERIEYLDGAIRELLSRRKTTVETKITKMAELRKVTTEDVRSIIARVTSQKDKLEALILELIVLKEEQELIQNAGKNRRDRLVVLAQLTAATRTTLIDANPLESALRGLESQKKSLGEELGEDHPKMKSLKEQIEMYKEELRRQNPDDPTGQTDELAALGKRLAQRQKSAELQKKSLEARLAEDEKDIQAAGTIQDTIDGLTIQTQQFDRDEARYDAEKVSIRVTQQGSAGYTADAITPPADGVKVTPVLYQSLLMGLAIGLLLGGGVLFAELTDKSFKSPAEIRRRLGLPVVGHIPQIRTTAKADAVVPAGFDPILAAATRPKSAEAEAYRGVRTQLYFSAQDKGPQVVQVTSPNPGDGKSTLAANLAVSIAQSGKRVILLDADFRKPRVHRLFGQKPAETGLAGAIAGDVPLASAIRASGLPNLDLLPCGPRPGNPAELLSSPKFVEVLKQLKGAYEYVIVDTPPVLAVSDPAVIAPHADSVLMVFRMTKKVRPAAERTREQLAALGANVTGVVVNGWSGQHRAYGDYNYGGSGYRYSEYHYADDYSDKE